MLSDNRRLRRASAYFLAGHAIYAYRRGELRSLSIESPDAVLSEAKAVGASALASYLSGDKEQARPTLMGCLAGIAAVENAGASTSEWDGFSHMFEATPVFRRSAAEFAKADNNLIVRLANSLIELRTVTVGQQSWLLDSPTRAAA